ncbi:DUF349 domain-containing protein [Thiocystis violacea]|uniref:DUF349 domain-containing protein n=1 Tax=Thiocystis violacea TaxID=13725 RepID=UPI0019043770|nr:DUF349 domain-containing protein [Thiocystis violacea]MBK1724472.1 hypothetical protein [Thiocystis violacea]
MLFKRFFERRRQASEQPKEHAKPRHEEALKQQALGHPEAARRLEALHQLTHLATLHQALSEDADTGVRETAAARLHSLLCDPHLEETPSPAVSAALTGFEGPAARADLALRGHHPEVRRTAIEHLEDESVLTQCAVEDRLAANRNLAVERIQGKAALEEVVRRIGKRDKNVYRAAREKLRVILEREERPHLVNAQCEDICAKLERLGRLGRWTQDRALLEHLDRQWAEFQSEVAPVLASRFNAERTRFLDAYTAYCEENATQLAEQTARRAEQTAERAEQAAQLADQSVQSAIHRDADALLAELRDLPNGLEEAALASELERIAEAWQALPPLPEQAQRALDTHYAALMQAANRDRADEPKPDEPKPDERAQSERLIQTAAKLAQMLAEPKVLDEKRARALLDEGGRLAEALPGSDAATAFQEAAEPLESRLKHQRKQAEQKLARFDERLEALEAHLTQGELKKADPLYQSLQAGIDLVQASGVGRGEVARITKRLRALAPRLRELQNWRRWGADQHREGLCAAMEELVDKEQPLEALAERLHALQMDWKGLDKTGSPANQALWERFHTASASVYERCRPFMEAQTAEREANRAARERACEQLDAFLAQVDWERVDWKKTLKAEREMRQGWAAIGPTEGRHRKALERRFHQSLRRLDQRLDAERKRNQAHKQDLVAQVQALIDLADLDAAIEQTKDLQREWHTTVPARQKDENKLWQRFRAACDAVFERRAVVQQAHANELKANLDTREAICQEARDSASREQDPKRLAFAQRELMERWRAAEHLPVPRQAAAQLAQAWKKGYAALEERRRAGEEQQRVASLDLLQRQSDLCQQLEHSALGDAEGSAASARNLQALWSSLGVHEDATLQAAMQRRFDRALKATEDPAARTQQEAQMAANAERLQQMCLQLEIAAGVESPPELAQQRLELQVARLAERMTEGEEDPLQGAARLLHDWYLCGPAARDDALNQRFARVRASLTQGGSATVANL